MTATRTPTVLAEAWRATLLAGDADGFAGLFAPDGVMLDVEHRTQDLAAARPICGRDAIRDLTVDWLAQTPDFDFEIAAVLADGESAAYRWHYAVNAEGEATAVEGITWLECEGGHIRRALVVFDSLRLLARLGTVALP